MQDDQAVRPIRAIRDHSSLELDAIPGRHIRRRPRHNHQELGRLIAERIRASVR